VAALAATFKYKNKWAQPPEESLSVAHSGTRKAQRRAAHRFFGSVYACCDQMEFSL